MATKKLQILGNFGNVELDKTLTISGQAADAKAVGDAFDTVEEALTTAGQVLATKIGTETGWGTKQLQSISNMEDDTLVHGVYYVNGANDSELGVVNGILIHIANSQGTTASGKQILITNNGNEASSASSLYVRSWLMGTPALYKWEQIGGEGDSGVDITQFGWGTNNVKTIADLDDYFNILNGVYWFDGTNESLANAVGGSPYGIFVQMYNSSTSYGAQMFFHMALKDGVYTADVYTRQIMWGGVHDWHKVGGGSDISVDDTLTQSGAAADAKVVGDWMNNVVLSENNYGTSLPESGEDGLVYFVEDESATDTTLTIEGAAADAKAVGDALAIKAPLLNIGQYEGDLNSFSLDNTICWIQSTTINNPTGTYGSCETWSAGNGGRVQRISCSAGVVQRIHTNSWGEWNWINQPELVWENASPSSEFAAQTVSLDLSDAGFVIIEFRTTSTGTARPTVVVANGKQGNLFWMANATANYEILVISRNATVSNTGITFEKGYRKNISSTTATENNASAIPTRIYAIKGAL